MKNKVDMAIEVLNAELETQQLECVLDALDNKTELYKVLKETIEHRKCLGE